MVLIKRNPNCVTYCKFTERRVLISHLERSQEVFHNDREHSRTLEMGIFKTLIFFCSWNISSGNFKRRIRASNSSTISFTVAFFNLKWSIKDMLTGKTRNRNESLPAKLARRLPWNGVLKKAMPLTTHSPDCVFSLWNSFSSLRCDSNRASNSQLR